MSSRRQTRQKDAILSVLESAKRPLSRDEIFERARAIHPRIGERTIYRALAEMVEDFRLTRVYYPGQPVRYETPNPDGGHHPHFICRKCQQVFILPDETPPVLDRISPHPDFRFTGEEVVLYGECLPGRCPLEREPESEDSSGSA